jgi:hypothetical protein
MAGYSGLLASRRVTEAICLAMVPFLSYDMLMKTLTIRLPDSLVAEIESESQSRNISKSDVVRERLRQPGHPSGGGGSMSEVIGDILEKSWSAKIPAGSPRFRSPKKQRLAEIIRAKKLHR